MVKVGCGSIVMAVIVCFGLSTGIYADDYGAWAYSRNCTLNTAATGANIDSNVYNFPVLIRLNTSNFNFNQLSDQSGGTDLRFAKSDGTHLAYQIERCDGVSDSAEIWVHLDTVRGNNSTQYLKMYWGKSGAGDSSRPRQVFDTAKGWRGVWHLNGTANLIDQTARQLVDTNHSTSSDAGNIGSSIAMGQGNWIGVPPSLMAGIDSNITVSFWNYGNTTGLPKSDDRIDIIMSSGAQWYNGFGWRIMQDTSINCYWGDGNGANNVSYKLTTTSQWKGQWNHWAYRRSPGTWWLYINGAQVATGTTNRAMNGNAVNRVELGSQDCGGDYSYRGKLDEMRFSRTTRSSQWIKLEYENQKPDQTLFNTGLAIISEPHDAVGIENDTVGFLVGVIGSPTITYQWQKNNVNIAGATNSMLRFKAVQSDDGKQYRCIVSNFTGTDTSVTATLKVTPIVSNGLLAAYYNGLGSNQKIIERTDTTVDFNWVNDAPVTNVKPDSFRVLWVGQILPQYSQTYTFYTNTDDGVRLWANGQLLIDRWATQSETEHSATISLVANTKYDIIMEYFDLQGAAVAELRWSSNSQPKQIIPKNRLFATGFAGTLPPVEKIKAITIVRGKINPIYKDVVSIDYEVVDTVGVCVKIYHGDNYLYTIGSCDSLRPAGLYRYIWHGTESNIWNGTILPPDEYRVRVFAKNSLGTMEIIWKKVLILKPI